MHECDCGFEAKSGGGLASHRRACDWQPPSSSHVCSCGFEAASGAGLAAHRRACNEGAAQIERSVFDATLRQVPDGAPAALAAAALKVARLIDLSESPRDVAALSRELRALLEEIDAVTEASDDTDAIDEVAAARERRRAAEANVPAAPGT